MSEPQQLLRDLSTVSLDALGDENAPLSARMQLFSALLHMQNRAKDLSPVPNAPVAEIALHDEMERNAMIDSIKELEKDRDELRQVARMSLQQFEFTYGKRKRGWDAAFLMRRLESVIANSEGTSSSIIPRQPEAETALEAETIIEDWYYKVCTPRFENDSELAELESRISSALSSAQAKGAEDQREVDAKIAEKQAGKGRTIGDTKAIAAAIRAAKQP